MMATFTEDMPTYYEVLGLPKASSTRQNLSPQQIKAAYRKALLKYHPDKSEIDLNSPSLVMDATNTSNKALYTVDQICKAYAILSVPKIRSEYDRQLNHRTWATASTNQYQDQKFRTGFETVDLEDLAHDEAEEIWYKSCRCGDIQGYLVRGTDLEEFSDKGELHVGCRGCSLWLRVLFDVIEEIPQHIPQETVDRV
jgi:diphthamide biosynthesis protein 4